MAWQVKYSAAALKALAQLDPPVQRRILSFVETRITDDPRRVGKAIARMALSGWRLPVGVRHSRGIMHDSHRAHRASTRNLPLRDFRCSQFRGGAAITAAARIQAIA